MKREGLRQRAERAWEKSKELTEADREERIAEEERLLRKKLIQLGAEPDEIAIKHKGERIVAEVEGMQFQSAFGDPFLMSISHMKESDLPGVLLLWRCPQCGEERRGALIRRVEDLGRELEEVKNKTFHHCSPGNNTP